MSANSAAMDAIVAKSLRGEMKAAVPLHPMFRRTSSDSLSSSRSTSILDYESKPARSRNGRNRVRVEDAIVEVLSSSGEENEVFNVQRKRQRVRNRNAEVEEGPETLLEEDEPVLRPVDGNERYVAVAHHLEWRY